MNKKKILVVEDDRLLREAYCEIIGSHDFILETASNGNEGIKQLKKFQPDLVLLDILMPYSDGLDFLKKAKIKEKKLPTKVIVFSNLSSIAKIEEMLQLGASCHVLKSSLSPTELVNLINTVIKETA